ncbi:hypothetical protein [Peribacillus simplex]|uniref:Uncharacterized protein n=1 Tax=Peribacillus simplex TaxID=1478 RepID=A0A8B5XZT4_9BACI|nr:hypothetical protein [Peribacillus simplex]MEC1397703.1 hypothetical protein [Peribacillus simplex]MED3910887.1 hypothetical protein [Peribacillus simplex]TVX81199.1 hypothetical protein FQP34_09440 [Peribacillus simplex]
MENEEQRGNLNNSQAETILLIRNIKKSFKRSLYIEETCQKTFAFLINSLNYAPFFGQYKKLPMPLIGGPGIVPGHLVTRVFWETKIIL